MFEAQVHTVPMASPDDVTSVAALFDNGKVTRRGVVSRKGHRFVMFDDDNTSGIALLSSDNTARISLNETTSEIHIHCKGKVTIDTDSDAISIKGGGDVTIEAQGSLSLKGQGGVKIQSSGSVELSGTPIKLN